jgi:hypothetical protein
MDRIDEKSVSKSQQRLMGQAYAYKKGELKDKDLNPKYAEQIKKMSDSMTLKQLKDFASTKHRGLIDKIKESKILSFKLFLESLNDNSLYNHYYNKYSDKYKDDKLELYIYCSIRLDFANELQDYINDYMYETNASKYYSNLCKTDRNPKDDYQMILNGLGEFKLEELKKIFNSEIDSICRYTIEDLYLSRQWNLIPELSFSHLGLNQDSGLMDVFFYFLLPELGYSNINISLGGDGWSFYVYESEELIIRYKYGYHRTDYGKLSILQAGMTLEEFRKEGVKQLAEIIDEDFNKILVNSFFIGNNKIPKESLNLVSQEGITRTIPLYYITKSIYFKDYHYIDSDRFVIATDDIVQHLNKNINNLNLKYEVKHSDLIEAFKKELKIYDLDISEGEVNLIIWDDFEN